TSCTCGRRARTTASRCSASPTASASTPRCRNRPVADAAAPEAPSVRWSRSACWRWSGGGGRHAASLIDANVGGNMKPSAWNAIAVAAISVLAACGGPAGQGRDGATSGALTAPRARTATVPKASCGPLDRPETGLQGQTPLADRQSGATTQAYNCNLEKVGQFEGEGASWQLTWFGDCAYYDTANNNSPGPQHPGTVVVDVSDPEHPKATDYLTGAAMM